MKPMLTIAGLLAPAAALAHVGDHAHAHGGSSFLTGLAHPLGGPDHLLAMVALGIWAALLGGRAASAIPAAFLAAMSLGGGLGAVRVAPPLVEPTILASVILTGAAAALALRPPLAAGLAAVALFGLAHGLAHGLEGPASGPLAYGAGFSLATAGLIAAGFAAGTALVASGRRMGPRVLGAGASAAGVLLLLL
jgi:urease accessory protein